MKMAFHFSLDSVLHYRQSIEHQQELRLRAANQRVARVRNMVEHLDGRRRELNSRQAEELSAGVTAAELRFELQCEAELLRQRRELEQQLAGLEKVRDQQRVIFQQARRTRETLEAVRDQQLRVYQKAAARRQQRGLDDLFLMRREYLRHG
jgi:flagellar export protein FliJ